MADPPATPKTRVSHPSQGTITTFTASIVILLTALGTFALTFALTPTPSVARKNEAPRSRVVRPRTHTDHRGLMKGPFHTGPEVTQACLNCHEKQANDVIHTPHYTWLGREHRVAGNGPSHSQPTRIGKKNLINNFCLSVESNEERCTTCHAGYGWKDDTYNFKDLNLIDCLVCHEQTGSYRKDLSGLPVAGTDLLASAESVARPTRLNCGTCHFSGGGGDAVKHGDLDGTLANPPERIDIHMGRERLVCVDCHRGSNHEIPGQAMSVSTGEGPRIACTDCHSQTPHQSTRLNEHTEAVACVTCHIPVMAVETPTKMIWDWSTAGQNVPQRDPHHYLKEKGSFVYASRVVPDYYWYNGHAERYLKGDLVPEGQVLDINRPLGRLGEPGARIYPFKVHLGKQPYDTQYRTLLVAKTYGKGGYWTDFDWNQALKLGSVASDLPYSGNYGFIETRMYWPLSHMVTDASNALTCRDCHSERGRLDWKALGYEGDPALLGSRHARSSVNAKGSRP